MTKGERREKVNSELSVKMFPGWRRFGDVRPAGLPRQLAFLSSEGMDHCAAIFYFNGCEIFDLDSGEAICDVRDQAYVEAWADCWWLDIPTVPDSFVLRIREKRQAAKEAKSDCGD